jgi:type I restriction enzyme R subunit
MPPKPAAHTEAAFEAHIEQHLLAHGGYVARPASAYDPALALLPDDLLSYIEDTQPKVWKRQRTIHKDALGPTLLAAFDKATTERGLLHVLRQGFKFYGSLIRVVTFRPAHGLNPAVAAAYARNRLALVRQLRYDPADPARSLDLALFVNGIPVATAELKNALTHQRAGHARVQYQRDRDPDAPLFRFKRRALVHFAVGSDEVWMTTRLQGPGTVFLPFNRGDGAAAGNPAVEGRHRTHYLWEQVWQRESLLEILARYAHLQVTERARFDGTKETVERIIFPRYHQLDAVRALTRAAREAGAGTHYLIQHSAGSGKSNTIAWLAHQLASLHDDADEKVYDGVIVLTDRRVLDQQLQETIYQLDHKAGVVRRVRAGASKSAQLAAALEDNAPIIICTLHSFGAVSDKLDGLPERCYAVVVDEAHSSQGGDLAKAVRDIIGLPDEDGDDAELDEPSRLAKWSAERRRLPKNLSYFAFTATPKFKTICLFGTQTGMNPETGRPIYAPFHLYSMRQAIEEAFILDVLQGYTTYKRYFKLVKAVGDDPELDKRRASRALARFVSLHPTNISQKTEIIIEHFRACVLPRLGGRAKAMVVTDSRLHAVRYKLAFDSYLASKRYTDVGALVAFSGEVRDPDDPTTADKPWTEPEMNKRGERPLRESELPAAFAGPGYNVLIVANKYQTGFDQPLLCAMYVDKRLSGIQAVQTLSRLNRRHPGKDRTFVLDFINERAEILESFQPYYEGSIVTEAIDPQRLYRLQGDLDAARVYLPAEIELFAKTFFKPAKKQVPGDNAALHAALDPAVDRYWALSDDDARTFRGQLVAYCNLYGFLGQIVPFSDADLEKRYAFGKMLLRKLPQPESAGPVELGEDVALKYYRLQKEKEGALPLASEGPQALYGPAETGTGAEGGETEKLSRLIELVNQRFGTDFDAQDLIDGVIRQLVNDERMQQAAIANDRANFGHVAGPELEAALIDRHARHGEFIDRVFSDAEILKFLVKKVLDEVYGALRERPE